MMETPPHSQLGLLCEFVTTPNFYRGVNIGIQGVGGISADSRRVR